MKTSNKMVGFAVSLLVSLVVVLQGCAPKPVLKEMDVLVLTPLTGPAAEYARYSQMGFDLAERDIRSNVSVKVNVRYVDTKSNPKEAVSALNQALLMKRPDAVISLLSSVLKAVGPILEQQKIPVIANAVAAPGVAKPESGLFRVFPTADAVARTAIELAVKNGVKTIAVVYVNDEYGAGSKESLITSSAKHNVNIVVAEPFMPIEKDFRNQWKRIVSMNPDCIFIAGYGPGYVAVLQQLGEQAYKGTVITDFTLTAPSVLKATGGVKEGAFVIAPAIDLGFEKKALAIYPDAAYFVNVSTAYDSLRILAAAGQGESSIPLAQRIASVHCEDGAFGVLTIAASGDEKVPLAVFEVKGGILVKGP
jgi:branched-chain amino acid transport system substrate-binding protein